mgnify:CR=1 FL=1
MFGNPSNDTRNAVHGSDSYESAGREIDLIFPQITGDFDMLPSPNKLYLNMIFDAMNRSIFKINTF